MQNKISYSNLKLPKTYLQQNERLTENFGKKCKAHRNPSPTYHTCPLRHRYYRCNRRQSIIVVVAVIIIIIIIG
jgi:hypothetical protein